MRGATLAVLIGAAWLAATGLASAHGVLDRSSPAAGTTLPVAPVQVDLWFSEPVDPALSVVRVLDAAGARVSGLSAPSVDGRHITVSVGALAPGAYTVRWRVLSTVDGHSTGGAFVFGVGDSTGVRPRAAVGAAGVDWPPIALVVLRWVGLVAVLTAAFSAWIRRIVIAPALRQVDVTDAALIDDATAQVAVSLRVGAAVTLLLITPIEAIVRTHHLLDVPLGGVFAGGQVWTFVLGTRPGWSLLARWWLALLLVAPSNPRGTILQATGLGWFVIVTGVTAGFGGPGILAGSAHLSILILVAATYGMISVLATVILPLIPDARIPALPAIPMAVTALMLAFGTLNTHAWTAGLGAILADIVHAAAATAWIGGSVCLVALVRRAPEQHRSAIVRALLPRVTAVAAVSVAALVSTGVYAATLHVPNARALSSTGYGLGVLAKVVLFAGMAALGAWSWRRVRRRRNGVATAEPALPPGWTRVLAADVGLGALALLAAAVITLMPPPRATTPESGAELILGGESGDLFVRLEVRPARPGLNSIVVRVTPTSSRALPQDARVLVRLAKLDEDLAPTTVSLPRLRESVYEAQTGAFAVAGFWQADVVVRVRQRSDDVVSFPVLMGPWPERAADPAATTLLIAAERAFDAVTAWRQEQQVTDSTGGTVTVHSEFVRPDRLRTRTRSGEIVIVGRGQVQRGADGTVRRTVLPSGLVVAFPYLASAAARNAILGREAVCALEPCRVVLWESTGRSAIYAAHIGTRTRFVHRLFMIASSRHLGVRVYDINGPVRIELP